MLWLNRDTFSTLSGRQSFYFAIVCFSFHMAISNYSFFVSESDPRRELWLPYVPFQLRHRSHGQSRYLLPWSVPVTISYLSDDIFRAVSSFADQPDFLYDDYLGCLIHNHLVFPIGHTGFSPWCLSVQVFWFMKTSSGQYCRIAYKVCLFPASLK